MQRLIFPALDYPGRTTLIHLEAPTPALIVEWPTGIFYHNPRLCPCCQASEAEGFVVALPDPQDPSHSWGDLCTASEEEALALLASAQVFNPHPISQVRFHAHPGNRYGWHRCSFDLEWRPLSLAFPGEAFGRFQGWLTWPWREGSGFDPRPWAGQEAMMEALGMDRPPQRPQGFLPGRRSWRLATRRRSSAKAGLRSYLDDWDG